MKALMSCLRVSVIGAMALLLAAGCQKKVVTQPEAPPVTEQKVTAQPERVPEKIPEQKVVSAKEPVTSKDVPKEVADKSREEKEGVFDDVLFDFDKYDVKDRFRPVLQALSSWMGKNPAAGLIIEGHCDERGTNEYNLALGDRRAKAVRDYLVSLGVASARIEMISYGEEKPLCREQREECWERNRRAHFVMVMKKGK